MKVIVVNSVVEWLMGLGLVCLAIALIWCLAWLFINGACGGGDDEDEGDEGYDEQTDPSYITTVWQE